MLPVTGKRNTLVSSTRKFHLKLNQVIESKKNDHPAEAAVESAAEEPQVTDAVAPDTPGRYIWKLGFI
jgi:hypothetical protein